VANGVGEFLAEVAVQANGDVRAEFGYAPQ
jgi:hypothetical protein